MRLSLLAAAALCASGLGVQAATITYTETASASGFLNGVSFSNALLTLVATVDSNLITGGSGFYSAPTTTFGGSVGTLGSFTLAPGQVFSNQQFTVVGFYTGALGDILDTTNPVFGSYDLKTATGPITGSASSSMQSYATLDRGALQISSIGASATFQAVIGTPVPAVPEPSTYALLALGLGAIGLAVRQRAGRAT